MAKMKDIKRFSIKRHIGLLCIAPNRKKIPLVTTTHRDQWNFCCAERKFCGEAYGFSSHGRTENFCTIRRGVASFTKKILNHGIIYTKPESPPLPFTGMAAVKELLLEDRGKLVQQVVAIESSVDNATLGVDDVARRNPTHSVGYGCIGLPVLQVADMSPSQAVLGDGSKPRLTLTVERNAKHGEVVATITAECLNNLRILLAAVGTP
jgi:hypothetical protein